jgi:hypothetical protein
MPVLAAIGDYVWYDDNMDGIQDAGEPGVPDVTVNLYDCTNEPVAVTLTDADGYYLFSGLTPDDYYLEFVPPAGYYFTLQDQGSDDELDSDANPATGRTECTTLDPGETDLSWDAGLWPCGDCEGGVTQLTLRYLGPYAGYVQVYAGQHPLPEDLLYESTVNPDETFGFSGNRPDTTMGSQISIYLDAVYNGKMHTSCSEPIGPGLIGGDFEVVSGYSRFGGALCPPALCDLGKPAVLTMRYTGQGCEFTHHSQEPGNVECEGDPMGASPVNILVTNKQNPYDPSALIYFDGQVDINTTFEVDAANGGEPRLRSETYFHITDLQGNPLQFVNFHTSCSQPLNLGDQFGSVILEDFVPEG